MSRDTTRLAMICPFCTLAFYGAPSQLERHIAKSHPAKLAEWKNAGKPLLRNPPVTKFVRKGK